VVKVTYKTNGSQDTLMCEWAHVRDGCLVFAHLGFPNVETHVPMWQMTGPFVIDKSPAEVPGCRPPARASAHA
jgi:hypothetical protein